MKKINKKIVEIGTIGKVVLNKNIINIIDNLHSKIGNTEWSGILFYKLKKGDISKMKDLEFIVDFIYPMNIGSSSYTEFDYNGQMMEAYNMNESLIESDTGLIHSHHAMQSFFSGTDTEELTENCDNYNYYLSLIVSFDKKYKCKVAFPSKSIIKRESKVKNSLGEYCTINISETIEEILIGDLEIEMENNLKSVDWLNKRIKKLKINKNKPKIVNSFNKNEKSKWNEPNRNIKYAGLWDYDDDYNDFYDKY